MNVHSSSQPMPQSQIESSNPDRRSQILDAALVCFAKRGFHQASMHDISAEAGISVGLIYRYFENKEAVISAMADRHKKEISEMLERARKAPTLLESLEILCRSAMRSEEHTSELQSPCNLVCRLLLEKKKE